MTHLRPLLVVTSVAALLLSACAAESPEEVQPISAILDSDINIAFDASGTSANLTVDTNIPVACAVIFGTDDSYGSIAVDNDMQGGAHHDHGPVLSGLLPDTEYQYILQGSDAAGTLYRSEPLTFRTPPASADPIDAAIGNNVAVDGTVVNVSSEFSDAFRAANAIDGDTSTQWSTAGDGDNASIEIDLGQTQLITAVAFRTRQMTDGTAITETFTIQIDGETLGPYPAGPEPAVLDQAISGRTVRIDAEQTTGGNTGATEIEIYATQ